MQKVELLSPVGNWQTLLYAIHNGCDAVYLAGKKYGARKYAENFDDDEMVKAINYCHLYGVKIYITVNTLVFNSEIPDVLKYISFLYENGVDALIMQDLGLIHQVRNLYPDLDIHISTQCHNHNNEGLNFYKVLGATRVVLDREMSLEEIKALDCSTEKEVFVHGALCVSYSGCCLFSSMNGGRSGNRGECVASCRLPYRLQKNDKIIPTEGDYLLSTRELNTLNEVGALIEAGITSFKIEGRMKSPAYVGYVTSLYRMMIDRYYNHDSSKLEDYYLDNLKRLYNRQFTSGYLFQNKFKSIMNIKTSNHLGVVLGKVIDYDHKYIKILLSDDLKQEDGIRLPNNQGMIINRLYNEKKLLVNKMTKGKICYIDNKVELNCRGVVRKTIDHELMVKLESYVPKKIPIKITLSCHINHEIELTFDDGLNKAVIKYGTVQEALNSPTSNQRIITQISRLDDTPFTVTEFDSDLDNNIFVSIKELNETRRLCVAKLIALRQVITRSSKPNQSKKATAYLKANQITISALVRNQEQLEACLKEHIDVLYTNNPLLYEQYKDKINIYLRLSRVSMHYRDLNNERLLVREIGGVSKYSSNNTVITDYTLNVTNELTIQALAQENVRVVTLSCELTDDYLKDITYFNNNVELIIYGTIELMVMKYCPLNMLLNNDQQPCQLCLKKDHYYLVARDNAKYPIINEPHLTYIMHKQPIDRLANLHMYLDKGINHFRLELLEENCTEIHNLIANLRKELNND